MKGSKGRESLPPFWRLAGKVISELSPKGPWRICGEEHSRRRAQQFQRLQAGDKLGVFEELKNEKATRAASD